VSPCVVCIQAAILQFVGGELPPTGRATDGLKQWQRTALQQLALLPPAQTTAAAAAAAAAAAEDTQQQEGGAADKQQQEQLAVSIGGQPPVSGALLAAVRVVLSQVGIRGGRRADEEGEGQWGGRGTKRVEWVWRGRGLPTTRVVLSLV